MYQHYVILPKFECNFILFDIVNIFLNVSIKFQQSFIIILGKSGCQAGASAAARVKGEWNYENWNEKKKLKKSEKVYTRVIKF